MEQFSNHHSARQPDGSLFPADPSTAMNGVEVLDAKAVAVETVATIAFVLVVLYLMTFGSDISAVAAIFNKIGHAFLNISSIKPAFPIAL